MENNPLFIDYNLAFDTIPFDEIKTEHFLPAIHEALKMSNQNIDAICSCEDKADFDNTILAFETSHEDLERVVGIYWHLFGAHSEGEFKKLSEEISPLLSSHTNDYMLNATLFKRIKDVYDNRLLHSDFKCVMKIVEKIITSYYKPEERKE